MVHKNDIDELKRMVTNLYDGDKACIRRVLQGIYDLESKVSKQAAEIAELKKK